MPTYFSIAGRKKIFYIEMKMPFNQLQSSYQPGPRIYSSLGSLLYETEVQQITMVTTKRIKIIYFL